MNFSLAQLFRSSVEIQDAQTQQIPFGAHVIVPNVFGKPVLGVVTGYDLSSTFSEELEGIYKYTVARHDATPATEFGCAEFLADDMQIHWLPMQQ